MYDWFRQLYVCFQGGHLLCGPRADPGFEVRGGANGFENRGGVVYALLQSENIGIRNTYIYTFININHTQKQQYYDKIEISSGYEYIELALNKIDKLIVLI